MFASKQMLSHTFVSQSWIPLTGTRDAASLSWLYMAFSGSVSKQKGQQRKIWNKREGEKERRRKGRERKRDGEETRRKGDWNAPFLL